jgi:hypothetical protein
LGPASPWSWGRENVMATDADDGSGRGPAIGMDNPPVLGHVRTHWHVPIPGEHEVDFLAVADDEAADEVAAVLGGEWHRYPLGPGLVLMVRVSAPASGPVLGDPSIGQIGEVDAAGQGPGGE